MVLFGQRGPARGGTPQPEPLGGWGASAEGRGVALRYSVMVGVSDATVKHGNKKLEQGRKINHSNQ